MNHEVKFRKFQLEFKGMESRDLENILICRREAAILELQSSKVFKQHLRSSCCEYL